MTSVENALEIAPDHDASHALHAQLLLFRNEHVQALDAIDQALRLDSENPVHHAVRAKVLLTMGRRNDAAESVAAGLRLAPEHPELLALCGTLHLRQANAAQAAEAYLAALRHDPSDEQAREGLLEALRGRHRVYREILRMRQGLLGLLKQHGMVPIFLALVTCAIGVRLIAGATGYNWVRGTLIAVLLVPKELANTFLLLHPIGRHALTRTEKVVAACVATALLASAVLAILSWLTASPALANAARGIGGLVLLLSFCHAISTHVRLTRAAKIRITILVLIALALLLTVLATR